MRAARTVRNSIATLYIQATAVPILQPEMFAVPKAGKTAATWLRRNSLLPEPFLRETGVI